MRADVKKSIRGRKCGDAAWQQIKSLFKELESKNIAFHWNDRIFNMSPEAPAESSVESSAEVPDEPSPAEPEDHQPDLHNDGEWLCVVSVIRCVIVTVVEPSEPDSTRRRNKRAKGKKGKRRPRGEDNERERSPPVVARKKRKTQWEQVRGLQVREEQGKLCDFELKDVVMIKV
jgi:hypothetical protein